MTIQQHLLSTPVAGGIDPAAGNVSLSTYVEHLARDTGIYSSMQVYYDHYGQIYDSGSNLAWLARPATDYWIDDATFAPNFERRATVMTSNAVSAFTGVGVWVPGSSDLIAGIERVRADGVVTYAYLKIEIRRISTSIIEATSDVLLSIKTV